MAKPKELKWEVDENGCWNVTSHAKNSKGYHTFYRNGKTYRIHRWMYEHHKGEIEEGFCVLHKCDNRSCCNPDHLFIGTHQENMADMVEKNRQVKGEKSPKAKLTDELARFILNDSYYTNAELAKALSVNTRIISLIRQRKTWKHIS